MWNEAVRWEKVRLTIEGIVFEGTVVEHADGPFRSYWISVGNLLNVICQTNGVKVGWGAKKYGSIVEEIIKDFGSQGISNDIPDDIEAFNRLRFKVIDGGKTT